MKDPNRTKPVRDQVKTAFIETLTTTERHYLRSKAASPTRSWMWETMARNIVEQARASGAFSKKTVALDILASLRNFLARP